MDIREEALDLWADLAPNPSEGDRIDALIAAGWRPPASDPDWADRLSNGAYAPERMGAGSDG